MENPGTAVVVDHGTGEVIEVQSAPIKLSPQAIAIIQENIALAEKLVTGTLERGVDWGSVQGIRGDFLFDTGTSKIMAAFNCYARHRILYREETDEAISITVEAELISRDTRQVVAAGMGMASTREKKWGMRWSKDPAKAGYTEAEISQLEQKQYGDEPVSYSIDNPNKGDLGNTILAMACKRGECDAVKSLPGVNSALRKLFDPKLKGSMDAGGTAAPITAADIEPDITLPTFWGMVKGAGISEDSAHKALGVASVNDWTNSGKLRRDAIRLILQKTVMLARLAAQPSPPVKIQSEKTVNQITAADVPDTDALVRLAKKYFNQDEAVLFASFGYTSRADFEKSGLQPPWSLFEALRLQG
jgi:hypothetical protein